MIISISYDYDKSRIPGNAEKELVAILAHSWPLRGFNVRMYLMIGKRQKDENRLMSKIKAKYKYLVVF